MVLKCAYNGVSFSVIKQTTRQLCTRLFRLAEHTSWLKLYEHNQQQLVHTGDRDE